MNVATLHKTNSVHDIVYKGEILQFKAKSHCNGIELIYFKPRPKPKDGEIQNGMHDFIQQMFSADSEVLFSNQIVFHCFVELKWWEKFLRVSLETKCNRRLKKVKREIQDRLARVDMANRIIGNIEANQ